MYHDPPILTSCKNVVPQKLHKSSVFGPMEFSQTLAPQVSKSNWFNHVYCEPPMFLGEIPIFGESSSINIDPGIELCFFDELKLPIVDRRVSPCISPTPKAPPYPLVKSFRQLRRTLGVAQRRVLRQWRSTAPAVGPAIRGALERQGRLDVVSCAVGKRWTSFQFFFGTLESLELK